MGSSLNISVLLNQPSFLIDDKGRTLNSHIFPAVHALFLQNAVKIANRFVLIGKKREIQFVFITEIAMLFDTVTAYTENDIAVFKESVTVIPESLCLQRAAGRIIFRIEI